MSSCRIECAKTIPAGAVSVQRVEMLIPADQGPLTCMTCLDSKIILQIKLKNKNFKRLELNIVTCMITVINLID